MPAEKWCSDPGCLMMDVRVKGVGANYSLESGTLALHSYIRLYSLLIFQSPSD